MRIDLVVSAGLTEVGVKDLLRRQGFQVRQLSPARATPGPRPGARAARVGQGTTGPDLVRELLKVVGYHRDLAPVVVLVDDADCRFLADGRFDDAAFDAWRRGVEARLQAVHADVRLVVLLASPEIEAWFVADWTNGFGGEFKAISASLRRSVTEELGAVALDAWGGPAQPGGGCAAKLSARIDELIATNAQVDRLPPTHRRYRKGTHGPDMVRRLDPEKVAEVCTASFRAGWLDLKRARDEATG